MSFLEIEEKPLGVIKLEDWEGRLPDLSSKDYHKMTNFVSASLLCDFLEEGASYYKAQLNPLTKVELDSDSVKLGTHLHEANLEGKIDKFILRPEILSKAERKKQGLDFSKSVAELKSEFDEECARKGKVIVTEKTLENIHRAHTVFASNKAVQAILSTCEVEKGFRYLHQETGLKCRFKADLIDVGNGIIYDYKTTSVKINPKKLSKHAAGLFYHIKAAHYLYGAERIFGKKFQYKWIFQSTKAPHGIAILNFKAIDKIESFKAHSKVLKKLKTEKESGLKSDFTTLSYDANFPAYAYDLGWIDE